MQERIPIYNFHNGKHPPTRYCDLIIEDGVVFLEKKQSKEKYDYIPWSDLSYQVLQALHQTAYH